MSFCGKRHGGAYPGLSQWPLYRRPDLMRFVGVRAQVRQGTDRAFRFPGGTDTSPEVYQLETECIPDLFGDGCHEVILNLDGILVLRQPDSS